MKGKEKRFSKDVNHCIAKKLAEQKNISTFVLEDLSGIRNRRRGKKLNKRLSSWPFHQLQMLLEYKAEALGKTVEYVDPRYTSQRCHQCGHIYKGNRNKSQYRCIRCQMFCHSDKNAAINIRDRYLSDLLTAVKSVRRDVVNHPTMQPVAISH